jgi:predicted nucleotidyltransferase component of viral defense system
MIDYQALKEVGGKEQTGIENVIREYLQNLFLKWFYRQSGSENFLFKGGTALKIVFNSPRFSEDLDFSGIQNGTKYEDILIETMLGVKKEGIKNSLLESKATSGGWLANLSFNVFDKKITIRNEISFRKKDLKGQNQFVSPEIIPAYRLITLAPELMVKEKTQAALSRQKSRDFFDIYFILRDKNLRKYFKLTEKERQKLIRLLQKMESRALEEDIRYLVPISFHPIISNLPERLIKELD